VFISEVNPHRQALARSLDVGEIFDPTTTDVVGEIKDRTGGVGVDAVVECSGNERALQTALSAVRKAGTVAQTGLHTKPASIDPMVLSEFDITLRGTWCYPVTDWPRIIDLIGNKGLPVEAVVSAKISMNDIVEKGFEVLLSPTGEMAKVLVKAQ
jgi:(R,R)-butanediol dehydrogenase/meso-butanediol dehydrogenase/diacetyl reductase